MHLLISGIYAQEDEEQRKYQEKCGQLSDEFHIGHPLWEKLPSSIASTVLESRDAASRGAVDGRTVSSASHAFGNNGITEMGRIMSREHMGYDFLR